MRQRPFAMRQREGAPVRPERAARRRCRPAGPAGERAGPARRAQRGN